MRRQNQAPFLKPAWIYIFWDAWVFYLRSPSYIVPWRLEANAPQDGWTNIFTCGEARRSMDHNWPLASFESSQGSLYRPEKHGNIGNWGHWVQFWGQPWPPRSFGGRHGLRGHQNGCWMQYGHGYQGNQGYWCQIWCHMTSEVVWRPPWPRRPSWPRRLLEAIRTWTPG